MATSAIFLSSSPPSLTFKPRPLPHRAIYSLHFPPYPLPHLLSFSASRTIQFQRPFLQSSLQKLRAGVWATSVASAAEDVVVPRDAAAPIADSSSQQIVSTGDDGVSTIISILLFVAFVGLSILTIGVIYIAVTDFLQKRESKKFEDEEAAKKKKGGKKRKVKARAGPKGFGQKPAAEEEEEASI